MTIAMTNDAAATCPNRGPRRHFTPTAGNRGMLHAFARRLSALARDHARQKRARRELESLLQADDHILRDIGISRHDLRRALMDC
jgi:uncharacterized protein YjiS (DUF1127 family)